QRLKELKVTYNRIASDDWSAFVNAFSDANDQWVGKQHTKAIEGNNCLIYRNIMYIGKRHQNGVFLIENWHLTDFLVY
ncbi:MAG: hypothetical protein MSS47_09150, partial [Bacteroidales bacterium]|nr:hypothetical protein [Bacteroidales bacterium]